MLMNKRRKAQEIAHVRGTGRITAHALAVKVASSPRGHLFKVTWVAQCAGSGAHTAWLQILVPCNPELLPAHRLWAPGAPRCVWGGSQPSAHGRQCRLQQQQKAWHAGAGTPMSGQPLSLQGPGPHVRCGTGALCGFAKRLTLCH